MAKSQRPTGSIDVSRQFLERGWCFFLPQGDPVALRAILEPANDGVRRPSGSDRASRRQLASILRWFEAHVRTPANAAPYASVKYAIERLTSTKIFLQPTDRFSAGFRSSVKFCPSDDPRQMPLFGVVFCASDPRASSSFWPVLHAMAHICLHLAPSFRRVEETRFTQFLDEYARWVTLDGHADIPELVPGRSADQLECEAECYAAAMVLALGVPVRTAVNLSRPHLRDVLRGFSVPGFRRRLLSSAAARSLPIEPDWLSRGAFESDWIGPFSDPKGTSDAPSHVPTARASDEALDFLFAGADVLAPHVVAREALGEPFAQLRAVLERAMELDSNGKYANVSLHTRPSDGVGTQVSIQEFARRLGSDHKDLSRIIFSISVPNVPVSEWTPSQERDVLREVIGVWYLWLTGRITVDSCVQMHPLPEQTASDRKIVDAVSMVAMSIFQGYGECHPIDARDLQALLHRESPFPLESAVRPQSRLRQRLSESIPISPLVDFDPRDLSLGGLEMDESRRRKIEFLRTQRGATR